MWQHMRLIHCSTPVHKVFISLTLLSDVGGATVKMFYLHLYMEDPDDIERSG